MIKIKPYSELPDGERIFNLYLYMAAMSMPFYPEDIFQDRYYYPDGITKKSLSEFNRPARRRTKEYLKMLNDYGVLSKITNDRCEEDALLAEALIHEYSTDLHKFLYDGYFDGHVDPEALKLLLKTPMDEDSIAKNSQLNKIFISADGNKDSKKILENVFRYDTFASRKEIYQYITLMGVDICPYCNRLYITVAKKEKNVSPIRPELDHYRNKSKYPFFALSIMNLIPSCSVCNHVKSNKGDTLLYPFAEGIDNDYAFRTQPTEGITYLSGTRVAKDDFNLSLEQLNPNMDSEKLKRAQTTIDVLRLDAMYSAQKEYVSDLMFQRYIFTDPMIQDLILQFPHLFKNERDVRNMLLLMDINKQSWGKRPLAKLTHDISMELDELYETADKKDQ